MFLKFYFMNIHDVQIEFFLFKSNLLDIFIKSNYFEIKIFVYTCSNQFFLKNFLVISERVFFQIIYKKTISLV